MSGFATGLQARGLPVTEMVTWAGSLTHPDALSVTTRLKIVVTVRFVTTGTALEDVNPGGMDVQWYV
jgi:hypothetical protein